MDLPPGVTLRHLDELNGRIQGLDETYSFLNMTEMVVSALVGAVQKRAEKSRGKLAVERVTGAQHSAYETVKTVALRVAKVGSLWLRIDI